MAIPSVDPDAPFQVPDAIGKPVAAAARTRIGRWIGINIATTIDPHLLRWSKGRFSVFAIYPHVQLTTTGNKSGQPRTVQLIYFTDGGDVIVMASSFGRPEHPAWYRNLKADPQATVTVEGESVPVVAREAEGADWDDLFAKAVRLFGGFADYHAKVTAAGRDLPIFRLCPAD